MSDALQERYAAIERQYSQGQWDEVLSSSGALLAELPDQPGNALRTRLILLQGHTLLYGLGQVAEAAAIYRQVLDSQPEAVLQTIAHQELERCNSALAAQPNPARPAAAETGSAAPSTSGSSFPFDSAAVGSAPAGQQAPAMPWLEALGGVDPGASQPPQRELAQPPWQLEVAEVIEEPEQIAVHQGDPQRAEVLDLAPVAELPVVEQATLAGQEDSAAEESTAAETRWETQAQVAPSTLTTDDDAPAKAGAEKPTLSQGDQPLWSPAEEAELARGLLTVVLR